MPDAKQIAVGAGVLTCSVLANVLLWFNMKYFVSDAEASGRPNPIRPSSYLLLQFGIVWLLCMLVAAAVVLGQKKNRQNFVDDVKRLNLKDAGLMVLASAVAIAGFWLVMRWFTDKDSGLSKFVPMRTALAVIVLAFLGVFFFREKLNLWTSIGLGGLFLGFIALFLGRFL
jgi:uncharacterized membrane protein